MMTLIEFSKIFGDGLHTLGIILLVAKLLETDSCSGISGKSQLLFTFVYAFRYLDLFVLDGSAYIASLKVLCLTVSLITLYLIHVKLKDTYDRSYDTFRIEYLLISAVSLALYFNYSFTIVEILWACSIYLEAVAMLPQMFLIYKKNEMERTMYLYMFLMGFYRVFYLFRWILRYPDGEFMYRIEVNGAIIQTAVYCLFFIYRLIYLTITVKIGNKVKEVQKESKETLQESYEIQKEPLQQGSKEMENESLFEKRKIDVEGIV